MSGENRFNKSSNYHTLNQKSRTMWSWKLPNGHEKQNKRGAREVIESTEKSKVSM